MIQSIPNTSKGESPNSLPDLRSPIQISLMVKVAKRKPLCNEGKPQKLALLDRGQSKKGDSLS